MRVLLVVQEHPSGTRAREDSGETVPGVVPLHRGGLRTGRLHSAGGCTECLLSLYLATCCSANPPPPYGNIGNNLLAHPAPTHYHPCINCVTRPPCVFLLLTLVPASRAPDGLFRLLPDSRLQQHAQLWSFA